MKVVVVGAGPSGLVTCKSLLEAASPDFPFDPIILEQEDDIGGTFRYRSYEVSWRSFQYASVSNSRTLL
jgi:dimethylaniline monooxygenase (N-oxide forming)